MKSIPPAAVLSEKNVLEGGLSLSGRIAIDHVNRVDGSQSSEHCLNVGACIHDQCLSRCALRVDPVPFGVGASFLNGKGVNDERSGRHDISVQRSVPESTDETTEESWRGKSSDVGCRVLRRQTVHQTGESERPGKMSGRSTDHNSGAVETVQRFDVSRAGRSGGSGQAQIIERTWFAKTARGLGAIAPAAGIGSQLCPPLVIRGAKQQVSVDWLRVSGPISKLGSVVGVFMSSFGRHEEGKGRYFYDKSWRFEGGAAIYFDVEESSGHFTAEAPGGALALIDVDMRISLLRALVNCGCKATRIDVAIDYVGKDLGLINAMVESCMDGHLCGARVFQPRLEMVGGFVAGRGITIGRRGKLGSGRYVRCYDKGLETKTKPAREWERLEVEFGDQVAMLVGDTLAASSDWERCAREAVLGAVDFRTGHRRHGVKQRKRCRWWEDVIADVNPQRYRAERDTPDLHRFCAWLKRCVAPTLIQMARESRQSMPTVWREAIGDMRGIDDYRLRPVVWQYIERRKWRGVHAT